MTEDATAPTCQQFQSRLPELIGSYKDLASDPHLQLCSSCRALLSDLESIAEAARELFLTAEPPEDLWNQIESALWSEEGSSEPERVPE
jgi:hypothetical protein